MGCQEATYTRDEKRKVVDSEIFTFTSPFENFVTVYGARGVPSIGGWRSCSP
jgi:hypothetical protein